MAQEIPSRTEFV